MDRKEVRYNGRPCLILTSWMEHAELHCCASDVLNILLEDTGYGPQHGDLHVVSVFNEDLPAQACDLSDTNRALNDLLNRISERYIREHEDQLRPEVREFPMAVFEIDGFTPPEGWVHVEKNDELGLFETDEEAAQSTFGDRWALFKGRVVVTEKTARVAVRDGKMGVFGRKKHE